MEKSQLVTSAMHGTVRLITINRAGKLNALNAEVFRELRDALRIASEDPHTRVAVLTGAGDKAFVVGMDVSEIAGKEPTEAFVAMREGQVLFDQLSKLPKPTIAMVNGYALGGGFELALSCDFIVASETARFGFPEINLATFPGWGGNRLAMGKMASCRAREMIWSGKHYRAGDCMSFGFINRIAPQVKLWQETQEFAAMFADKEPLAIRYAKLLSQAVAFNQNEISDTMEAALYAINFGTVAAKQKFEESRSGFKRRGN
jgi:enoyl-CoA hydratase